MQPRLLTLFALGLGFFALTGCDSTTTPDAGADGGLRDASVIAADAELDSGSLDGSVDAGEGDGGAIDAGAIDAGAIDGGRADAGVDDCSDVEGSARVWLVGDSTVASGSGWGDFLASHLPGSSVDNRAAGGRSSKSYYDEGRFTAVREALLPGDYVLIQFGHNDSKPEEYRRTEPGSPPEYDGTYREYLVRYLDEIEAAGAIPILVTSVSRMVFGSDGRLGRTHGEYPAAMRRLASDRSIALLDLEEHSFGVFDALGEAETLRLYAEEGDRTHFPPEKAPLVTDMVATLIRNSDSTLRCHLAP